MENKPDEVPNICPLLNTCERDVAKDMYDTICTTENWMVCSCAKALRKKYQQKPSEWRKMDEKMWYDR